MPCTAGLEALRYATRVVRKGGPRVALAAMMEMLEADGRCFEQNPKKIPSSWIERLLSFLDTSIGK
jgi:hypothetical protein